jgi:hypothetical protein
LVREPVNRIDLGMVRCSILIPFGRLGTGLSFRHAVELLRDGAALVPSSSSPVRSTVRRLAPPVALDADDQALLTQVVDYYHETLKQSPEALAYLAARGLVHPELIDRFRLGLADRTLGLRLPEKTRKAGADIRARLERGNGDSALNYPGALERALQCQPAPRVP